MAGSNYSVNITLDTSKVEGKLKTLEKRVANFRKNLAKPLKISAQTQKLEEKKLKMQDAQRASMIQTRKIGDLIQKQEEQGLKVDKARAHIRRAAVLDNKKLFKSAELQRKLAVAELKAERETTKELSKQAGLKNKMLAGGSTGFTAAQYGPQSAPMQGPAMPPTLSMGLNFDKRTGKLLQGPAGSSPNTIRNLGRRFDAQSALISGGFPLLFGQGPVGALAGGLGGGIGGMFGQMGGFAGGIAATALTQSVSNQVTKIQELGKALDDTTKNIDGVTSALGITGTEFEKNIQALQKMGETEEAFEQARQRMIRLVGTEGVTALQNFGRGATELSNQFAIAMTQMRASLANFLGSTGVGRGLTGQLTRANLIRQAQVSEDPDVVKQRNLLDAMKTGVLFRSKEQRNLIKQNPKATIDSVTTNMVNAQIEANRKAEGLTKNAASVTPLDERLRFLQESLTLGREQATIEQKIRDMKRDGVTLSKEDIRDKLRQIAELEKVEAMYQQIGSAIENGIVDAIEGAIQGTKTLGEVATSVFNQISRTLLQFGVNSLLSSIPGIGGLFKADGGPVKKGGSYIVGERGPELFTPGSSGMITPNHQLGGATTVVVNVDASGSSVEGDEDRGRELGRLISVAVQSELLEQKRPGGLLA